MKLLAIVVIALLIHPLFPSHFLPISSEQTMLEAPSSPLEVNLSVSNISGLTGVITCNVSTADFFDAPNTEVDIVLPEGFVVVSGDLSWIGDIAKNSTIEFSAVIEAVVPGNWTIAANAKCELSSDEWYGDSDYVYVPVSESSINSVSKTPPYDGRSKNCEELSDPPEIENATSNTVLPNLGDPINASLRPKPEFTYVELNSTGTNSSITVTGRFWYWDNNLVLRPLVWATVWIYDSEWWGLDYKGGALTNINGYFTFGPISNDDGWLEDGLDIVVCIVASTSAARVIDAGGNLYDGWTSQYNNCPDGTLNIGDWSVPSGERGAWMIFSYHCGITAGWNYLANKGPNYDTPMATCRWPYESWPHYHLGGEIHLPDFDSARSPDVIIHEYGHHVMWNVYNGYWPPHAGGAHQINRHSHPNLAWTEGWANLFPLVVQNDPVLTFVNHWSFNLETPTWGTPNWDNGDDVEGRVTGALWDIFDSTNEGYDAFSDGFLHIWDVVHAQTDNNFAQFWAAWRARGHNIPLANAALYQNTINYNQAPSCVITFPNVGGWFRGTITITATASDSDGSVTQVEFQYSLDGNTWINIGTDTSPTGGWSAIWNTDGIADSSVWVRARARDNLQRYSPYDRSDSSFGVDNAPPTVSVFHSPSSPRDSDSVSFGITVSEYHSGLSSVTLYWYDGSWHSKTWFTSGSHFSTTYSGGKFVPRTISYYATAIDVASNTGRNPSSGYKSFNVVDDDTTAPSFSNPHTSPSGIIYDSYTGDITCYVDITDGSGLCEVGFSYRFTHTDWSPWGIWTGSTSPGTTQFHAVIPRSTWTNYVGQISYFKWYAIDNDDDRPNDKLRGDSSSYTGPSIADDDVTGPALYNPGSSGDIYDWYSGDYLLQISAYDSSGIYSVHFAYRFGSGPWSDWKPYTGHSGDAYWYYIPRSEWIIHVGETIYWQAYAWDNDVDRPGDALGTSSPVYTGGTIYDDDTTPPSFSDPLTDPSGTIYDPYAGDIKLQITVSDPSGISIVRVWVFGSWRNPTGSSGNTYWYNIARSEWTNHVGETWSWKVYAEDNDNDRPNDHAEGESSSYLGTNVVDDDVNGPSFSSPSLEYIETTGAFRLQIDILDPSGIYMVQFRYKFEGGSWSSWHAPSGSSGNTHWHDISSGTWTPHTGETVYWQVYAEDNDDDRVGDRASSQSSEYSATLTGVPILHITGESPVNILVTDPNGLRVGYDPVLGSLNEIPGATYSGPEPQVITIPNPVAGTYTVDAFGTGTGTYTITMDSYASDGSLVDSEVWSGAAEPGQQYTQDIELEADGDIIDATPPITEAFLTGTLGLNGWYVSNVDVELVATDGMSGVATTEYSLDGTTWLSYTAPLTISNEGTTIIHYNSTDNDGNTEETKTEMVRIDKNPPDLLKSLFGTEGTNGWYTSDVTVTLDASDAISGVASIQYSFDGSTWHTYSIPFILSDEGIVTLHHKAIDTAGNEYTLPPQDSKIDKTPPTPIISAPEDGGHYTSASLPALTYSVVDNIDPSPIVDVTGWSDTEGIHTVTVTGTDAAGNTALASITYTIDNTPPVVTITTPADGLITNQDVTLSYTVSDDYSAPADIVVIGPASGTTYTTEGSYNIEITATDEAGNSASASVSFTIDKTPPVVIITAPEDGAYYTTPSLPALVYTVTDDTDPSPGVSWWGWSDIEGIHTVTVTATDAAGNIASSSVTYTVDNTPPVVIASPDRAPNSNGWYNADVIVTFTATDALSGIASVDAPVILFSEGAGQSVAGYATDLAGNVGVGMLTGINVDKTPPIITGAPTESANAWGWYNSDVTIHFTAADTLSGLDSVTPSQTLTGEGAGQSVTGYATDLAGNTASHTVTGINIDKTPPTITGAPTTTANAYGWYRTDVIVHFEASDSLSGLDTVTPDQTLTVEAAAQSVAGTATDKAGNIASYTVSGINIDKTPPTLTGYPTTLPNENGWYNNDVIVHFSASDTLSGILTVTPDQTISTEGSGQTVTGSATDLAGNLASYTVTGINIDKTPPIIIGAWTTAPNVNGWYNNDVIVHFEASDALSGIQTVTPDQTLTVEGADQSVAGTATDLAGNSASCTVSGINIDKTPPTITGEATEPPNSWGWYNDDVTVHFTAADTLSGLDSVTPDQTLPSEGAGQSATGTATDQAGNTASYTVSGINIDKTPPTITGAPTTSPNAYGWYDNDVIVHFTAVDVLSGLDSVTPDQTLPSEGAGQSATGTAVDKAGNTASYTVTGINIDKTPPTISGAPTTSANIHGWYRTDVIIHFEASDALSGIVTLTPDQTLTAEGAGQSAIGTASDKAGNTASYIVGGINIDKTPPTISGGPTTSANVYDWYKTDVIIHFDTSDPLSGIDTLTPDITLSAEGAGQSATGTAVDRAGNEASYIVSGINIDKTPPVINGAPTTLPNAYGWYNNDVIVHFTASDSLSGLDTVTPDQTLTSEGAGQSVIGTAVDKAGNTASCTVGDINIDRTKPTTSLAIGEPKFGTDPTYVSTTTDFTLEAIDAISDIEYTEYRIDLGPWTIYSTPFNVLDFGSHTIHYHSLDMAGNSEDLLSVSIVVKETRLTYQGNTVGQYSDLVTLEAKLIDMATQLPIQSKLVSFSLGSQSATATTENTGIASASIVLDQPAGAYTVTATFETDGEYFGSSDSHAFTIFKEDFSVEYTGDTVVPTTAKSINLRATIFDSPDGYWGDLTEIQVTFSIYAGLMGSTPFMTIPAVPVSQTDMPSVGVAVARIDILPENGYLIILSIDSNDYYEGPTSDATPLTVYEPTGDFVTGGGWIWDSSGSKGNFGFNVKYTKSGKPRGHATYVYRESGWDIIVKSNAWIGLAIDGNHAYFEAKCVVQKYNPATGELVWDEGNYKFRVDVWDKDPEGGVDIYQIRVLGKHGVLFHEAGCDPLGELQGGNIIIHDERRKH